MAVGNLPIPAFSTSSASGKVKIADCPCHLGVHARRKASGMSGDDHGEAAVLVRVCFGVLVDIEPGSVWSSTVPSPSGIDRSLASKVGELFNVPAADVAQDALAVGAVGAGRRPSACV